MNYSRFYHAHVPDVTDVLLSYLMKIRFRGLVNGRGGHAMPQTPIPSQKSLLFSGQG